MLPATRKRSRSPRVRSSSAQKPAESAARIARALEEEIVLGYLHQRERLVEDELMERFGAKRHVVRQALLTLERIGVVERKPNRGATVIDIDPDKVREIYEVREVLETAAASRIALLAARQVIEQLSVIQRRYDVAAKARDLRAAFRINVEFHRVFFASCGNACLAEVIDQMGQKVHVIRSLWISSRDQFLADASKEHWDIIAALEEGDREKLIRLCREHIAHAKNAYLEAYRARFPDPTQAGHLERSQAEGAAAPELAAS